ncbi:Uma2 family endonuclease [Planktothrix mougeotii LEGE 06226]|uniref:Uma2 family endonuclease n=2 Tax=Planktothrix mougeotii TaxID=54306 RepID=A0ABR9U8W8_9CYAN|nr:Uma2 family endonuclease [Planktothrix mougeotii LEGE 06226]
MVQTVTKKYSFEDYLNYRDDTDLKYELFNGELIQMTPASGWHSDIIDFIQEQLKTEIRRLNLDWVVRPGTVGVRTGIRKSRIPDILVMTETQRQLLRTLPSAILEEPPLLAIEIVSPNNPEDDYRYKRSEYAALGISEYWIIDPQDLKLSILTLVSGLYEVIEMKPKDPINSITFPELKLTVEQILNPF